MPGIDDALDGKSHQGLLEPRPAPASRHRARSAIDNHPQPDRRRAAPVRHLLQSAFALPEKAHPQEIGCQKLAAAQNAGSLLKSRTLLILPDLIAHLRL